MENTAANASFYTAPTAQNPLNTPQEGPLPLEASESFKNSSSGVHFGSESGINSLARRDETMNSTQTPSTTANRSYHSLSSLTMSLNSSSQSTEATSASKEVAEEAHVISVVTNMPDSPQKRQLPAHGSEKQHENWIEDGYDTDGDNGPSKESYSQ